MKTLAINELSVSKKLDRKAMSAVRGGETFVCGTGNDQPYNPFPSTQDPHNFNYRDFLKSLGTPFPF